MSDISARIDLVRARVARACRAGGRSPDAVTVVAIGKALPPAALAEALRSGVRHLGESYVQEALPKVEALRSVQPAPVWHFVGPVQSNKTADIARQFDWVHGVDRAKVARRLSAQRPDELNALNVCVQVNISGERAKSGVTPEGAHELCRYVSTLPRLRLRGLMAIPAPNRNPGRAESEAAREPYRRLRELFESLRRDGFDLDTLSAGMSDDFEAAIAEGSTMVRIGTDIFGPRKPTRQDLSLRSG